MPIPNPQSPIPILGWREWVALPELGLLAIHAKLDTGAATSALLAVNIEHYAAGAPWVRFCVHPLWPFSAPEVVCEARLVDQRQVKASSGHSEMRLVIRTELRLGVRVGSPAWPIEVTLADRRQVVHPMLLGREALAGRVLVDAGREYVLDQPADPGALYG